jgi:hypothetical protein
MKRSILLLVACTAIPLGAIAGHSTEAKAQTVVVEAGPPASYIAAYRPIYYNGFAHYLWHDRWFYRDHVGWRGYGVEPGVLRGYRGEWAHHWYHWR